MYHSYSLCTKGQDDFINNTLEVTFEADEMNHTKNRDVVQYIRITNDMISERPRQYFEVALSLPDGVQLQPNISLQRRNKSICVIIDRDNRKF